MQEAVVAAAARRPHGRYRAAVAGVRELRHVSRLRTSRRCVRRGGPRARQAATHDRRPPCPTECGRASACPSPGTTSPWAWWRRCCWSGLIMVTSASMSIAARDLGDPFYFLERQFIFGAAGVVFAWVVTRVPAELWDKYSLALLLLGSAAAGVGADSRHRARRSTARGAGCASACSISKCRSSPRCWC